MTELSIEGGCSCRAVRYRIQGEPLASVTCQCRSCRKTSAAAIVCLIKEPARIETEGRRLSSSATATLLGALRRPSRSDLLADPEREFKLTSQLLAGRIEQQTGMRITEVDEKS